MASKLVFSYGGSEISCGMSKIDRTKLYGYVDTEVRDENDELCELATLAGDGKTLIPLGGVALSYFSSDGEWREKVELTPVDANGKEKKSVPSSFKAPIALDRKVSVEDYISHNVRMVYALDSEEGFDPALLQELDDGAIYEFQFSYRGGLEPDSGFLLRGQDGTVWMAVGKKTAIEFVGFEQVAAAAPESSDEENEDGDLDFGMM